MVRTGGGFAAPAFDQPVGDRPSAMACDHLHDAADCVGAVQRALRARDELDPLHVADVQQRQVDATAERVHADAVHEHERVIRFAAAREHGRECTAAAAPAHRQARYGAHRVGKALDLPVSRAVRRDYGDVADDALEGRLDLRGRDHDRFRHGAEREGHVQRPDFIVRDLRRLGRAVQAGRFDQQPICPLGQVRDLEAAFGAALHRPRAEQPHDGDPRSAPPGRPSGSVTTPCTSPACATGAIRLTRAAAVTKAGRGERRRMMGAGRPPEWVAGCIGTPSGVRTRRDLREREIEERTGPGPGFLTCGSTRAALRLPMPTWSTVTERAGRIAAPVREGERSPLTVAAPCGFHTQLRVVPG